VHSYFSVRPVLLQGVGNFAKSPGPEENHDPRVPATEAGWEEKFHSPRNNLAKRNSVYASLAREDFLKHPAVFAIEWVKKQLRFYAGTGTMALARIGGYKGDYYGVSTDWKQINEAGLAWYQVFTWLLLATIYAGALYGLVLLYRQRKWNLLILLSLLLLFFSVSTTLVPHTRYRFPMMYLFAIASGIGIQDVTGRLMLKYRNKKPEAV
jgi:hypothetical protein